MRRTILILSLLTITLFFMACGEKSTTVTNANASAGGSTTGASGNSGTTSGGTSGETAGSGPQNQGIGGTSEGNTNSVNGNTYTVPPGFNKNGDRGSASNVSKTP
ncbi:MAG TPA: hypothetical protein VM095_21045 [Pyrinomonadaceae bacterium]|nr:hypothetical protein [Pyrinomonadaceae bacterium]